MSHVGLLAHQIEREEEEGMSSVGDLREVQSCPACGAPLIAVPVLSCADCGEKFALRCFAYQSGSKGYIAECIDLDLMTQGKTIEGAIGKLQEAMFGYLEVAFDGKETKGLVLRPSPLGHRLHYYLYKLLTSSIWRRSRHRRHFLPVTPEPENHRFSHC